MDRRLIAVGLVVALVAGGAAFAAGFGPAPGGSDDPADEPFPTATATPTGSPSDGTATATPAGSTSTGTATTGPAFEFVIDRMETCGRTCRDVTSTLRNGGDARATGVVVRTRVFVGKGTDGDVAWSGRERVGTLAAGGSYTAIRRVELSYSEGIAVRRADGWITIQTTVTSDQRTVTFTDRRQVA